MVDGAILEIDERQLVLLGEHARDRSRGYEALIDEYLAESLARVRTLELERSLEVCLGHRSVSEEERAESGPLIARLPHGFHLRAIGRTPPSVE
jgi:hypothetical protein